MTAVIDYYLTPQSPWTYLGHTRFFEMATRHGCEIRIKPCDYSRIYAASGGLPLQQRAAQRQAYRLTELQRFSAWLGIPLNLQPKFFPVSPEKAARLLLAALGDLPKPERITQVMRLIGAIGEAVWAKNADIGHDATLIALANDVGLDGAALFYASTQTQFETQYRRVTEQAIIDQVFGAPTYAFRGELFWGQDRLDFLERALHRVGVGT